MNESDRCLQSTLKLIVYGLVSSSSSSSHRRRPTMNDETWSIQIDIFVLLDPLFSTKFWYLIKKKNLLFFDRKWANEKQSIRFEERAGEACARTRPDRFYAAIRCAMCTKMWCFTPFVMCCKAIQSEVHHHRWNRENELMARCWSKKNLPFD